MITFGGYSYDDHKACVTCRHILDGSPILLVLHEDDGDLQFACGEEHHEEDWLIVGLSHLTVGIGDLAAFPPLPPVNAVATRSTERDQWQVEPST